MVPSGVGTILAFPYYRSSSRSFVYYFEAHTGRQIVSGDERFLTVRRFMTQMAIFILRLMLQMMIRSLSHALIDKSEAVC